MSQAASTGDQALAAWGPGCGQRSGGRPASDPFPLFDRTDEQCGQHSLAASEMRIMERDHLVLFPASMACPLCEEVQANTGFCPRCRHTIMELYRTRGD